MVQGLLRATKNGITKVIKIFITTFTMVVLVVFMNRVFTIFDNSTAATSWTNNAIFPTNRTKYIPTNTNI